jgi:hypothetical protein
MDDQYNGSTALKGKTYSLYGDDAATDRYYSRIKELTDLFLQRCPDEKELLARVRDASVHKSFLSRLAAPRVDDTLMSFIKKTLKEDLSSYTRDVKSHLKSLPMKQRFDSILRTKEHQYHTYMIEIELTNRIYREAFRQADYKFALIAHCLRDFRPDCRSVTGDYESICKSCTKDCLIHLGSDLLIKYDIHPYISVSMELEVLFKKIKAEHNSVGALGIACVPELVSGIRLCTQLGIPPVGIPLDANRCARWMEHAHESTFNINELENLVR